MGVVILAASATSNRSLRREMNERFRRLSKRVDRLIETRGEARERLGRVEGMLKALG